VNRESETWVEWQREHTAALAALQEAQRAYHRSVGEGAFAGSAQEMSAAEMRKDALDALDAARVRLDGVRARKPAT
jgi:hypothetical protein